MNSMKTSFVSEINIMQAQPENKPKSLKEQRKSRQSSKQGHTNPLKMKTSFLRQSLSLNPSEQNLTLNLNNPANVQRNPTPVQVNPGLQSDRRQDFMMRKIVDRFSNNPSPKNMMYPQHGQHINEAQRERDIIKLSGRKNEHLGMSQIQKPLNQEKQNRQKSTNRLVINNSGVFTKNQPHPSLLTLEKPARLSHDSTLQSIILDNSLADYANSLTNSFLQHDQVSLLKQQLQLVLKRLAKNQCDIETLKRDKNIDTQMEGVWNQLSLCESKFEVIEKRWAKSDEKLVKVGKAIQEVRDQIMSIDQGKLSLVNQFKTLENKILTDLAQLQQKIPTFTQQHQQSQRITDSLKKIKSQMQGMFQIMSAQLDNRIETKFSQLKWDLKSDKIIQSQDCSSSSSTNLYGRNGNKFILSSKKAHKSIALVYKELLKVNKPLSSSQTLQQSPYISSDRKKLLQSVLNQSYTRRTTYSLSPITPQKTNTQSYFRSDDQTTSEIEINQVEYFIDPEGYLLDESQYYILDERGEQIRLDGSMIELMKRNGVLKC